MIQTIRYFCCNFVKRNNYGMDVCFYRNQWKTGSIFCNHIIKPTKRKFTRTMWKVLLVTSTTGVIISFKHLQRSKDAHAVENLKKFNFIADIAKDVMPAVVNVRGESQKTFGRKTIMTGSGFIVRGDGLIITSASLIGKHTSFVVRTQDGTDYNGKVVAVEGSTDLGALKIQAKNLPTIALNKHNDTRVGEWVMAYGSPLALKNTITVGIVSNVHRISKEIGAKNMDGIVRYLQTDAIINNGNSGGPLVNLAGEVIGINTLIASTGIGFAIPVDHVETFVKKIESNQFKKDEKRFWIGVRVLTLTRDLIMQISQKFPELQSISVGYGLFVDSVGEDSPAARAGIKHTDIILEVNGVPVTSAKDISDAFSSNRSISFKVRRKEQILELNVTPDEIS